MVVTDGARYTAGPGTVIERGCVVGQTYPGWREPARLGDRCHIRWGSMIYADTVVGGSTVTGVHVLIRAGASLGARCVVGSMSIIEGDSDVGDDVVLQSGVYIPTRVTIGNRVFIGPCAVLTNDRFPVRARSGYVPQGPVLEDDVTIGANATLLTGVRVHSGAMVGAGAVVTRDVPPWSMAVGVPARIRDLPESLKERNTVRGRT